MVEKLEKIQWTLLWMGMEEKRRVTLVGWDVCVPQFYGRLWIRRISHFNKSLLTKTAWILNCQKTEWGCMMQVNTSPKIASTSSLRWMESLGDLKFRITSSNIEILSIKVWGGWLAMEEIFGSRKIVGWETNLFISPISLGGSITPLQSSFLCRSLTSFLVTPRRT